MMCDDGHMKMMEIDGQATDEDRRTSGEKATFTVVNRNGKS